MREPMVPAPSTAARRTNSGLGAIFAAIFEAVKRYQGYTLSVDLPLQTVSDEHGWSARFEIDPFQKKCLLEGLDEIALTLMHDKEIAAYEAKHPTLRRR